MLLLIALQGSAHAQAGSFVTPPRTIADITAILDQEKPDLDRLAATRARADAPPPQNVEVRDLVEFYFNRAFARSDLGRYRDAIADLNTGIEAGLSAELPSMAARGVPQRLRASPHTEEADAAKLAMLPRLPDTRLELMSIAKTLHADPARALYLGKQANEQNVESLDLSRFRIVAFATHGLIAGDLDGLTGPALALTAPDVAEIKGDGLLTVEKILKLKLDADWVLLSACNTAAGAGAGAAADMQLGD